MSENQRPAGATLQTSPSRLSVPWLMVLPIGFLKTETSRLRSSNVDYNVDKI